MLGLSVGSPRRRALGSRIGGAIAVGSVLMLLVVEACSSAPSAGGVSDAGPDAIDEPDVTSDVADVDGGDEDAAPDAGGDADADAEDADDGGYVFPIEVHQIPGVVVETFAGSSTLGSAEGTGSDAQFANPVGVAVSPSGLLVVEYGGRVRRIDALGDTSLVAGGFHEPFGIAVAPDAIFVQTDHDVDGGIGPTSGAIWRVPNGGSAERVVSGLGRPRGLARLPDGRIVVSDWQNNVVSLLDPATSTLTPLAGSGTPGFADGHGASAKLSSPYGVAVLPDGSFVLADLDNHRIRRITPAGDVTVFAGDGIRGMNDDVDPLRARFDEPKDVATDAAGNVYVTDTGNHRIRRISTAGVESVAGDGTDGFLDGEGGAAKFFGQEQLDVTADGKTIYVSDGNGGDNAQPYNRVRRVTLP